MADIKFSIRIVDQDGEPLGNTSVFVSDNAIFSSGCTTEYTNVDGWTEFSFYNILGTYIDAKIIINDDEVIKHVFCDGDTASFTYSND